MKRPRLLKAILHLLLGVCVASAHTQLTFTADDHDAAPRPRYDQPRLQDALAFDPLDDLHAALDVMQSTWFQIWIGTWPSAIDWTRAVLDTYVVSAVSTLSKALQMSQSAPQTCSHETHETHEFDNEINQYFAQNIAYYFGENAFSIRNQAYDDMLWVVLGWLESIKFIGRQSRSTNPPTKQWHGSQFVSAFAHRARVFYEIAGNGWDTDLCGGGMNWNPSLAPYKNAITNELFISASVGMYLYFPGDQNTSPFAVDNLQQFELDPVEPYNPEYLKAAVDGYAWLKGSGMMNHKGLYVDGFHISNWRGGGTKCDIRNEMVYSYNQGVILSGLRALWESTGTTSYLEDGHELVRNAIKATGWNFHSSNPHDSNEWQGLGRGGILEDRCDALGTCSQDSQTFKGIFMHHLSLLCEPLPLVPLVPGKTYAADKWFAGLHHNSCQEYAQWVAHNARAALATRDEKGKFGAWWRVRDDAKSGWLPEGAIDYRNNASALLDSLWWTEEDFFRREHGGVGAAPKTITHVLIPADYGTDDGFTTQRDLNDRGRGRTVETQGGGVSVLRTLWELLYVA